MNLFTNIFIYLFIYICVEVEGVTGLEGDEEVGVSLRVDEGVVDLCTDDESVLLDARDASGFFDSQRGEAFTD